MFIFININEYDYVVHSGVGHMTYSFFRCKSGMKPRSCLWTKRKQWYSYAWTRKHYLAGSIIGK